MEKNKNLLTIKSLENINLEPSYHDGIDYKIALKNHLLFSRLGDEEIVVIDKNFLSTGLNYLSKISLDCEIYQIDTPMFDALKDKYMESFTDSDFANIKSTTDMIEAEEELLEFVQKSQDLLSNENSAPVIKLVNSLFFQAIKKGASDIHIQTMQHGGEARFRINGILKSYMNIDKHIVSAIINRIKVISSLDISEKRVPQDGRTQISIANKTLDVRVSILPTYHGERVVMRILMQSENIPTLEELGFDSKLTDEFYKLLHHSYGMILVTGPTGSGKSTTLHSFLQYVYSPEKNIITIEDPVEYNSPNISQIQVNEKVGLSFASGLRSILRQDPDVIMIGEIRDSETATIAIQAALTGHLLLSTLHTNNATASLTRLLDMGVKDYLLSSVLLGVLAQRLVRLLCPHCKKIATSKPKEIIGAEHYGSIYEACGCEHCDFTGYIGRRAIGELFIIDNTVKDYIKDGLNDTQIRELMKKRGMKSISDSLKSMLQKGETSYDEALRVGINDD
ncbi:MAG: general secretion pathway protein GspE [Sulfurovum sp. AS07-7]|nr:MAG: general secretion pathway protein GspE [Sulfurovum sp. AS07-7]